MLENDLYKFSMSHYYQIHYPNAWGTFIFHDRNNTQYSEEFLAALKCELSSLSTLSLQAEELQWAVKTIHYIPQCFWEWLCYFRFEPEKIDVWLDNERHLHIEVSDLMYKVTFYEIPILATVSELFHLRNSYDAEAMIERLEKKEQIARDNNIVFSVPSRLYKRYKQRTAFGRHLCIRQKL